MRPPAGAPRPAEPPGPPPPPRGARRGGPPAPPCAGGRGGRALPDSAAVTYPAHWGAAAVDALGASLSRVSEWSRGAHPLTLVPDAAAALFAARANPGIPARGIVAVCDLGGSGTSITLVDA